MYIETPARFWATSLKAGAWPRDNRVKIASRLGAISNEWHPNVRRVFCSDLPRYLESRAKNCNAYLPPSPRFQISKCEWRPHVPGRPGGQFVFLKPLDPIHTSGSGNSGYRLRFCMGDFHAIVRILVNKLQPVFKGVKLAPRTRRHAFSSDWHSILV